MDLGRNHEGAIRWSPEIWPTNESRIGACHAGEDINETWEREREVV